MKEQTILEFTKMKLKKVDWFQKKSKINRAELTTDEMLKYNELKKHQNMFSLSIFIYPLYLLFWAGLYSIVYKMAFGLDFSSIFLLIITLIGRYWLHTIFLLLLIIELPAQFSKAKYNKKLMVKIIKERKGKKK